MLAALLAVVVFVRCAPFSIFRTICLVSIFVYPFIAVSWSVRHPGLISSRFDPEVLGSVTKPILLVV